MSFVPLLNNAILSINAGRAKLGQMLCPRLLAGFRPLKKPKTISFIVERAVAILACHRLAAIDIPHFVFIQSFHKITPQSIFAFICQQCFCGIVTKTVSRLAFALSGLLYYNFIKPLCQVNLIDYYSFGSILYCRYKIFTGGQLL